MQMPAEMVGTNIDVAAVPVGRVISLDRELWYSAEGVSWQRVHRAPARIALGQPAAGDEDFLAPTSAGDGAPIYASGDGLTWFGPPPGRPRRDGVAR